MYQRCHLQEDEISNKLMKNLRLDDRSDHGLVEDYYLIEIENFTLKVIYLRGSFGGDLGHFIGGTMKVILRGQSSSSSERNTNESCVRRGM